MDECVVGCAELNEFKIGNNHDRVSIYLTF